MLHAIRLVRHQPHPHLRSQWQSSVRREKASVRFQQARAKSTLAEGQEKMEDQKQQEKTEDIMSDSYGKGYSTRSNDEGFGGVYGTNEMDSQQEEDKGIHEKHRESNRSQGSEVREEEKGHNQPEKIISS